MVPVAIAMPDGTAMGVSTSAIHAACRTARHIKVVVISDCITWIVQLAGNNTGCLQVRLKDDKGAVDFGRSTLSTASKTSADQQLLQDVLTLMAYNEPESSPEGYLLSDSHKINLAATVNAAILTQKGQRPESNLERLLKQLVCVHAISR